MIKTLPEPCWVIEPNPTGNDDSETHYLDVDYAARALAAHLLEVGTEDGPEEVEAARNRLTIVAKPHACRQVACDGCQVVFEDDEEGITHAVTDDDETGLLRLAVAYDWQPGSRGDIYCTECVVPDPLPPGPGPGQYDLPFALPSSFVDSYRAPE